MGNVTKVNLLKWVKETFQFNKDFLKIYNNDSDEGYFI